MSYMIKQSTAISVAIGPFLDETDGKTIEGSLTITQPDIRLSKNGAAFAQKNAAQTLVHMENGYYSLALDDTDTNTLGRLTIHVHESGALPVWMYFMVAPANIWDSLYSTDKLQVDLVEWIGVAPDALATGKVPVDVKTWLTGTPNALSSGNLPADIKLWLTGTPDALSSGKVASDLKLWLAAAPLSLTSQLVQAQSNQLGAQSKLDVNAEVDSALDTAVPVSPVADSINERIKTFDDADIPGRLPSALVTGRMDSSVEAIDAAVSAQLVDDIMDESITGAEHNVNNSLAKRIRQVEELLKSDNGTLVAATASTVTLKVGSSADNDFYINQTIIIVAGTGVGQSRLITDYDGGTRVATISKDWGVTPSTDSEYFLTYYGASDWDRPQKGQIRQALGIDGAKVAATGGDIQDLQGRIPAALVTGRIDSHLGSLAADVIQDAGVGPDMDTYQARISMVRKSTSDLYLVKFLKNGTPVAAGSISTPTIRVYDEDGSDLIAVTALSQIGSEDTYKKEESTNRIVLGTAYFAVVSWTQDSSGRSWEVPLIGRDA